MKTENSDGLKEELDRIKSSMDKHFGPEMGIEQFIRNCQVEEEYVDEMYNNVVQLLQACVKDERFREAIMNLKLREEDEN